MSKLKELAEKGSALYERRRAELEQKYPGKYLAIEPYSERIFPGDSPEQAAEIARTAMPDAFFHFVRVGGPELYRMSSIDATHGLLL